MTEASTLDKYRREIELLKRQLADINQSEGVRKSEAEKRLQQIQDLITISAVQVSLYVAAWSEQALLHSHSLLCVFDKIKG